MNLLTFSRHKLILTSLFIGCCLNLIAQTKPKTYTFLIYHKLNPGLTIEDALPVEREWKTINQAAVDEGNLEGWYMTVKQFTSNPNQTEYDYVTKIVSREMAIKGASSTALARLYGDSVQAKIADLQRRDHATAPVVKVEIWENTDGAFDPGFVPNGTQLMIVDRIRRRNPVANDDSLMGHLKQRSDERIGNNTLLGWDFSTLIIPDGSEKGYALSSTHYVSTMSAVADPGYKQFRRLIIPVFDVVRQEIYRFQEYTIKSGH